MLMPKWQNGLERALGCEVVTADSSSKKMVDGAAGGHCRGKGGRGGGVWGRFRSLRAFFPSLKKAWSWSGLPCLGPGLGRGSFFKGPFQKEEEGRSDPD